MDWLRRNWPDLIIGVALVAVIAGIVATLLSGGSFLSFGGQRNSNASVDQPPAVQNSQNSETDNASAADNSGINNSGATNNAQNSVEPVLPDLPGNEANAGATGGAQADAQAPTQSDGAEPTATSEQTGSNTSSENSQDAGQADTEQPDTEQPGSVSYRVSVGAFGSRSGAQSLVETYRSEGLPAFVASQGDLSLALIGPYDNEAEASRVAQQVIDGGGEAIVYTYTPDSSTPDSSTPDSGQPTAGESSSGETASAGATAGAPADTTESSNATNSAQNADSTSQTDGDVAANPIDSSDQASGTFLQVGAFGSVDAAQSQRDQLEELGFGTAERQSSTGLVRLFAGPFNEGEIGEAQARLESLGIDSFPVSLP